MTFIKDQPMRQTIININRKEDIFNVRHYIEIPTNDRVYHNN